MQCWYLSPLFCDTANDQPWGQWVPRDQKNPTEKLKKKRKKEPKQNQTTNSLCAFLFNNLLRNQTYVFTAICKQANQRHNATYIPSMGQLLQRKIVIRGHGIFERTQNTTRNTRMHPRNHGKTGMTQESQGKLKYTGNKCLNPELVGKCKTRSNLTVRVTYDQM